MRRLTGRCLCNTGSAISISGDGKLPIAIPRLFQHLYIGPQMLILVSICSASSRPPHRARASLVQPASHHNLPSSPPNQKPGSGRSNPGAGLIKYRVHARSWPLPRSCPGQGPLSTAIASLPSRADREKERMRLRSTTYHRHASQRIKITRKQ